MADAPVLTVSDNIVDALEKECQRQIQSNRQSPAINKPSIRPVVRISGYKCPNPQCQAEAVEAIAKHDKRASTDSGFPVDWFKVILECMRCDFSKETNRRFKIRVSED